MATTKSNELTLGEGWTWTAGARTDTPAGAKWKEGENEGWKTWDPAANEGNLYQLLISAVTPRPIAFVSTLSSSGVANLSPFSYFSLISHDPPLVTVSASRYRDGKEKDTAFNIRATKEFTVNIISEPFIEAANATSIDAPSDKGEFAISGLTPEPSLTVKPPRVRESAVSLECELFSSQDLISQKTNTPTGTLFLGLIKRIHVRRAVLAKGDEVVDPELLRPISRLGGVKYATLGNIFELRRPTWDKDSKDIQKSVL